TSIVLVPHLQRHAVWTDEIRIRMPSCKNPRHSVEVALGTDALGAGDLNNPAYFFSSEPGDYSDTGLGASSPLNFELRYGDLYINCLNNLRELSERNTVSQKNSYQ